MVSYVSIVYGFLADLILFGEKFGAVELIALTVMMSTILGISIQKVREKKLEAIKEGLNEEKKTS
jgi:drug/metabolite transporter (DMT)-like permease